MIAKTETRAIWTKCSNEFGGAGIPGFARFLDVLSKSSVARMKVPSRGRDLGRFLRDCDRVVVAELGEQVLAENLGFLGVSADAWLEVR